jgi:hypothetical protein
MSKSLKALGLALGLCAVGGASFFYETSTATIVHSVDCSFEPVAMPKAAGPVALELAFTPKHECDEVKVKVSKIVNLEYTGDTAWVVPVEKGKWYRRTLNVSIPDGDTSGIEITMQCGRVPTTPACYFVTTGDTVEVYAGKPSHKPRRYSQPTTGDPIRDTLTLEQLQTEYEVVLDLRDSADLKIALKIIGPLPKPIVFQGRENYYKLKLSLQKLINLADEGIEFDFTIPPPWAPDYVPPKDSVLQPPSPSSSETDEINVDTLTPGQLKNEHEVILWFRDSTERKLTEQVVGPMQDSLRLHGRWGVFRVKMTLEKFLEIRKHNVDAHLFRAAPVAPPSAAG